MATHAHNNLRSGMTLVEVTISIALLGLVTIMTMESLISSQRWRALGEAEDGVNRSASYVLDVMSTDLAESGWWFPDDNALSTATLVDRGLFYFPYVQQQSIAGLTNTEGRGIRFLDSWRSGADVAPLLPVDPEILAILEGSANDANRQFGADITGYRRNYFARSQELFFLKQASMGWVGNPELRSPPTLSFDGDDWSTDTGYTPAGIQKRINLGILMPSGWESDGAGGYQPRAYDADGNKAVAVNEGLDAGGNQLVPYGVPLSASRLDVSGGTIDLNPQWETMAPADYNGGNPQLPFREYFYTVVPSPLGLGRLVRAYSMSLADAAGLEVGTEQGQRLPQINSIAVSYVVDKVLSDDVVRIVCDTFRTDSTLLVNEVRVRLYFARVSTADTRQLVTRIVESILIMRAKATPADDAADQIQAVGVAPFPF